MRARPVRYKFEMEIEMLDLMGEKPPFVLDSEVFDLLSFSLSLSLSVSQSVSLL